MRHSRNRQLLRIGTGEERMLAVMVLAALVFVVLSTVGRTHPGNGGLAGARPRGHAGPVHAPAPTTAPRAATGTPSAGQASAGPGVGPTPSGGVSSASNDRTLPQGPTHGSPTAARPHMLSVRTVPPIPNATFSFDGTTFTSDVRSGVALVLISQEEHDRLVTDLLRELTVTAPAVPLRLGARAVFDGWVGPVASDGPFDTAVARFRIAA